MDFKQITIDLLSAILDAGTEQTVCVNKNVCDELLKIMLQLDRLYGAKSDKKILEQLCR